MMHASESIKFMLYEKKKSKGNLDVDIFFSMKVEDLKKCRYYKMMKKNL